MNFNLSIKNFLAIKFSIHPEKQFCSHLAEKSSTKRPSKRSRVTEGRAVLIINFKIGIF